MDAVGTGSAIVTLSGANVTIDLSAQTQPLGDAAHALALKATDSAAGTLALANFALSPDGTTASVGLGADARGHARVHGGAELRGVVRVRGRGLGEAFAGGESERGVEHD